MSFKVVTQKHQKTHKNTPKCIRIYPNLSHEFIPCLFCISWICPSAGFWSDSLKKVLLCHRAFGNHALYSTPKFLDFIWFHAVNFGIRNLPDFVLSLSSFSFSLRNLRCHWRWRTHGGSLNPSAGRGAAKTKRPIWNQFWKHCTV